MAKKFLRGDTSLCLYPIDLGSAAKKGCLRKGKGYGLNIGLWVL